MSYPPDFEGLSWAVGKLFGHETNVRCYKTKILSTLKVPPPTNTSVEKMIGRVGWGVYMPPSIRVKYG